ncbi:MAG TPA: helix-hairpin-helix domain-containing protein [Ignavibacteriaceae bacterium]
MENLETEIQVFQNELEKADDKINTYRRVERKRFEFNPNIIGFDSLVMLGFPEYLANRIVRFRNAGGKFFRKEDLKKIFGMKSELYREIEQLILIPQGEKLVAQISERTIPSKHLPYTIADLNTADSSDLVKIRGIGPAFSGRILKYRSALGGFVSKNQLKEVYGMTDSLYNEIQANIEITSAAHKFNLNEVSENELKNHPYFREKKLAGIIVKYRIQHGQFKNLEELKNIHTITVEQYDRFVSYLYIH